VNKKLLFALVLVLVASLFVISSITLARSGLARLEIINKTDQPASISLSAGHNFYYLTVPPATTKLFTVERATYDRTTWSCGKLDSGSIDILTQIQLTFTNCYGGDAPNWGEPGLEKVHIPDSPGGVMWRYK
jgi:hypothetical protein